MLNEHTKRRLIDVSSLHEMDPDKLMNMLIDRYINELNRQRAIKEIENSSISALKLSTQTLKKLANSNVLTIKELHGVELLKIDGIGPATVKEIEEAVKMFYKLAIDVVAKMD